jgi:hypothetical protein
MVSAARGDPQEPGHRKGDECGEYAYSTTPIHQGTTRNAQQPNDGYKPVCELAITCSQRYFLEWILQLRTSTPCIDYH